MLEHMSLEGINTMPVRFDVVRETTSDNRLYVIYSELKDSLQDFGFPTLSSFKAHINASPKPSEQLAQWQGLAARR